ncbi:MAG: hypothetical protein AVDCRST_MAG64-2676 [uncultured Phycisphaerae bacterium]|uniref:Uncharacterized protein n=1 Tax=uncultured Phycisphaerae bacterium TaxID=904963 RepID=A0A6J4PRB1_9BACT|nr:MAG: hypothetical protein AVDCRST_MAG64-2676 [uncultured Phycisphaerae bacterium]
MGERVVVTPGAASEPAAAGAAPKRVVPLGYGQGDSWSARMGRAWGPFGEAVDAAVRGRLGGWRRVVFAIGLGFTIGGFGYGLATPYHADETGFLTAIGGVLIGLTVPVRGFDERREKRD